MQNNKKPSGRSVLFWRIVISAVGVSLILLAVCNLMLFFTGDKANADVSTRRYGGADSGRPVSQRYHWYVDYTFKDKDGKTHSGHLTGTGSDISVTTDNVAYYFPFAPFISTLESHAEPNLIQLLYVTVGIFLIYIMNGKKKKTAGRNKPSKNNTGEF